MTELLLIVGAFVFFISVYGAVMLGGHLLAQLENDPVEIAGSEPVDAGSIPVSASPTTP